MQVGVVILPQFPAAETRLRWKSLEDRGFAHGWTYDHLAWRDLADEPWYATVTTLATAAAATTSLDLGTWVTSPNFRHPVPYAKELLSLDDLAGDAPGRTGRGRMIAAIGAGGLGWDATVLGHPELTPGQRVDRLTEFVALTDLLLRQPETSKVGQYFTADRARMQPAGTRSRIQLVVAGNGPRSVRLASGYDGWATTGPDLDLGTEGWWARLAELVEIFETAAAGAGRDPAAIRRYLSMDSAPGYSFTSLDSFTTSADRAQALGFTDVVLHWPRPAGPFAGDETVLDAIAGLLTKGHYHSS
ncbi:alkanesulfonate monooxygenase SsuD/methylene tetrahydromethanopterin reductase-like flavin-dependent oxidoreductase (luciferase family) [Nakamurella sp. UYEF19]|uniref:LLM class flavin-dependent oxidoreductase n=1 Tax=Nakamurella sp. UYEF19 TaxID=1756392 RepID=UPI003392A473